jgi:hypothetical protein
LQLHNNLTFHSWTGWRQLFQEQTTFISKTMESVTRAIKRMALSFFSTRRKEEKKSRVILTKPCGWSGVKMTKIQFRCFCTFK